MSKLSPRGSPGLGGHRGEEPGLRSWGRGRWVLAPQGPCVLCHVLLTGQVCGGLRPHRPSSRRRAGGRGHYREESRCHGSVQLGWEEPRHDGDSVRRFQGAGAVRGRRLQAGVLLLAYGGGHSCTVAAPGSAGHSQGGQHRWGPQGRGFRAGPRASALAAAFWGLGGRRLRSAAGGW